MEAAGRSTLLWIALLWAIECMDILTTAIGRARGFIETMPMSAAVMNAGGIGLFGLIKLGLVVAGAVTVLLALRWARSGRPGAGAVFAFAISAIRVTTVVLAIVSLHNAVLLQSLQGAA